MTRPRKPTLIVVWLAATLLVPYTGTGEPNPFGTGDAPPPKVSPESFDDEPLDAPAGANAQSAEAPPPLTAPETAPSAAPSRPTPSRRSLLPSRSARNSAPAEQPAIPKPAPVTATKGKGTPSNLADYLQLDSAVKGLEVKNFDLPDKEIRDVVTLISKWTGKNFILDSKVRGKITILGPSQVTLEEAYQAFLSALEANGLTTVKSGKFIRVIEAAEARRSPVETFSGDYAPDTDQFITRIFQLKYINADEVQREFRDLTTRQGKLFAYEPTNSIIITDTGSNIKRIQEILDTLDVKGFETTLQVLRIKNTSAKAIAEMLEEIYGDSKSGGAGSANRARTFRRSALERTRGGGIISKIIPDEQTNSLLVLANRSGFNQLLQLVRKLDVRVTDTGRIHVYYCEYAKAEDLAATLAALSGSGAGAGAANSRSRTNRSTTTPGAPGGLGAATQAPRAGPVTADLEGGVKIASDAATNSLVITANSGDYNTLKRVIKKLDIPRLQVFVETAIMEINIDKDTKYGVNVALSGPGKPFAGGFIGDPSSLASFLTNGLPGPGLAIPIVGPQGHPGFVNSINAGGISQSVQTFPFMAFLNLITSKTNSSVLSTPQIIAMDNEKAEFKVLDETPVQSTFVASVGGVGGAIGAAGQGSIENKKTGIEINLTPHVNAASKSIRMEIEQKVDSIRNAGVPAALQGVQIATTSRVTNTTVVVKDQDFVMLGGLMSDKIDEEVRKVPLLGDIPILGWLFKAKSYKNVKTNLVILLRPRIIGTSISSANVISEALEKRDEFLKDNVGDDVHEKRIERLKTDIDRQKGAEISDPFESYRNNNSKEEDDEELEKELSDIKPDPKKGSKKAAAAPEAAMESGNGIGEAPPLMGDSSSSVEAPQDGG